MTLRDKIQNEAQRNAEKVIESIRIAKERKNINYYKVLEIVK